MLKLFRRYKFLILGSFTLLLFIVYFFSLEKNNVKQNITALQSQFKKQEIAQKQFLDLHAKSIHSKPFNDWNAKFLEAPFFVHAYQGDSLVYWNTNEMPVHVFADIHFPADGLVKLQNGWYYTKSITKKGITFVASFPICSEYTYENEYLSNEFSSNFKLPVDGSIVLEKIAGREIKRDDGTFLFSFVEDENTPFTNTESIFVMILLVLSITFLLMAINERLGRVPYKISWLIIPILVGIRLISLHFDWTSFLHRAITFQPELYAQSDWFPTFGDFFINCAISVFIVYYLSQWMKNFRTGKLSIFVGLAGIIFGFFFWHYIVALMDGLIDNSTIPLLINRIFSLNAYSLLSLISIGFLYYGFYRITRSSLKIIASRGISLGLIACVLFPFITAYFIYEYFFGLKIFIAAILPLLYYVLALYHVYMKSPRFSTPLAISYLLLLSASTAIHFTGMSRVKELANRELYANQLASDKDVIIELEYANLSEQINNDSYLSKFTAYDRKMNLSDFEDAMERRFFNKVWDKYELSFNLFDTLGIPLVADESQNFTFSEINDIVQQHCTVSEVSPFVYFVDDYTDQLHYVIRQPLSEDEKAINAVLYCTLKSKKIPEEIGFPRLLISSNTSVLKTLESYSIARYSGGKLVAKYGTFNYPTKDEIVLQWQLKNNFSSVENFNHYVLKKSNGDIIILSQMNEGWFNIFTSFSFVFCFYGLLLSPILVVVSRKPKRQVGAITLAVKIQLVLLGLVFISLLAFSWGSSFFVNDQYVTYSEQLTREKLNSVSIDLKSKLGTKSTIDINEDGNYMEYLLRRFSKIFVADINLYNTKGHLLASSRPKIYNIGLQSEQINPTAFQAFMGQHKSEFIHQEQIGQLKFISAYIPFYNSSGKLLGLINLQHFGQQEEYETQIQQFLVGIINVFMLLLMLSSIFSIFISSWVIAPLHLLQESFSKVKFGKSNQKIDYVNDDEIGALVRDYNDKLEELEFAAQQIAKNEREMAWREMAKQVAHEIKNPLTPMKLSIQQLQRVFDPNDPNAKEKIDKVSRSLIEQIDSLTNIANEFSSFAKMPQPNEIEIDLVQLIASVIEVFQHEDNLEVKLSSELPLILFKGDKDQLLRVFNNLIKNAIQAIPAERDGRIAIQIKKIDQQIIITISDNGTGISAEEQKRIFEPYFTTKSTGTGLGLAMVRQIIENHRGQIYFESTLLQGTTFTIEL
ncbi:MAG: ATP-binding protein [Bacteroidota bacterium]